MASWAGHDQKSGPRYQIFRGSVGYYDKLSMEKVPADQKRSGFVENNWKITSVAGRNASMDTALKG